MNTYKKFAPNVFVAVCESKHEKGSTIIVTTKYGKENEHIVHNLVGYLGTKENPLYCYSITRADGFNSQERAKRKAEKLGGYASNAEKRSNSYYKKSDLSEDATGIPFGQPILVGHHSERRHRKTIERANNSFRKSVEEQEKADEYKRRQAYWESQANKIDLSMPESIEYFAYKLEEAKKIHKYLKDNPDKRAHSFSLTYAKKDVNNAQKNLNLAIRLWGTDEQIKELKK